MDDKKLNELVSKIWQRHRSALEFLIEQQPNEVGDFCQKIADSNLPRQICDALKEQGVALTFIPDTGSNRYIRLAVHEWDKAHGMLPSEEEEKRKWVASKRMMLFELDVHASQTHARWVVGPAPQEYREAFIEALEPDFNKKNTGTWTIIRGKKLVPKKEMELVNDGEWDEELVSKVVADTVKLATETVKEYDAKLRNAGLLS